MKDFSFLNKYYIFLQMIFREKITCKDFTFLNTYYIFFVRDTSFKMKRNISTTKANTLAILLVDIFIKIFKPYRFSSNNNKAGEKKIIQHFCFCKVTNSSKSFQKNSLSKGVDFQKLSECFLDKSRKVFRSWKSTRTSRM